MTPAHAKIALLLLSMCGTHFFISCGEGREQAPVAGSTDSTCRCCSGFTYLPKVRLSLGPPKWRDDIGTVPCGFASAQPEAARWCDQGMALLHAFWELEAWRSFARAVELDPTCTMGYWGLVMSLPGKNHEFAAERAEALRQAERLAEDANPRERRYVAMARALVHGGTSMALPLLRELVEAYPNDPDALALLGYYSRGGYSRSGVPDDQQKEALALLEGGLAKFPHHLGLRHYYIHVLETGPEFAKGLESAEILAERGKGSGHLRHMPGHIYYFTGRYQEAVECFEAAGAIDKGYLAQEGIPAFEDVNFVHNLYFLAVAHLERGQRKMALAKAHEMQQLSETSIRESTDGSQQILILGSLAAARVHLRLGEWKLAADSLKPYVSEKTRGQIAEGFYLYALAQDGMSRGALHDSHALVGKLEDVQKNVLARLPDDASTIYIKAGLRSLDAMRMELKTRLAALEGDRDKALFWADSALEREHMLGYMEPPALSRTMHESLGWIYREAGWHDLAESSFLEALKKRPGNGMILLGLALSAKAKGDEKAADNRLNQALEALKDSDPDLEWQGQDLPWK